MEIADEVRFETAVRDDLETLLEISRRAFEHDIHYGAPRLGGPPGYDSLEWLAEAMQKGRFFKISVGGTTIGAFVVFPLDHDTVKLGRVFLDPEFQNRKIGRKVLAFAEQAFPGKKRIVLDTPIWNRRNRHFYEKAGFIKIGEVDAGEGFALFQYEKILR